MKTRITQTLFIISAFITLNLSFSNKVFAAVKTFKMYTVETSGVKMWVPSTLVVKKGDDVEITATSKIPGSNSIHGFTIEEFKVVEVADENGKTIKFKATKEGIFELKCHLHPAHLGAQLIVLK